MTPSRHLSPGGLAAALLLAACASVEPPVPESESDTAAALEFARTTSVFGPAEHFTGSPLEDVGLSDLYPVRPPDECEVAVLRSGEDSFAARLDMLKNARSSIRIQAHFGNLRGFS